MLKFEISFVVLFLLNATTWAAHPSSAGRYHFVTKDLTAPIYRKGKNGTVIKTTEFLPLKQGQIIKTDRADEKHYWLDLGDHGDPEKTMDFVVIPDVIYNKGESAFGESTFSPQDTLRPINVSLVPHGPETIITKTDELRELSNIVYYDSKPGRRVSLTRQPEPSNIQCNDSVPSKNPCVGWPTTGDGLLVLDSKAQYIFNPLSDRYEPKVYYFVSTSYCPRQDFICETAQLRYTKGWIQADRVSFTKRDPVPGKIRTDRWGGPDHQKNLGGLSEIEKARQREREAFTVAGQCIQSGYLSSYERILNEVRKSLDLQPEGLSKSLYNEVVSNKVKDLGNSLFDSGPSKKSPYNSLVKNFHQKFPKQKRRGSDLTDEELKAIDSLARTIFGEVRGCIKENDTGYAKAVAKVVLNRSIYIRKKGNPTDANWVSEANPGKMGDAINKLIVEVVGNYRQFSIFNPTDRNLKMATCPDRYSPEWRASVEVAYQAVTNLRAFLEETKYITQTRYYSPVPDENGKAKPPWKDGRPKIKFMVGGTTYGVDSMGEILSPERACIILFSDAKDPTIEDLLKSL